MNKIAKTTFSYFDTGKHPSEEEPERFSHGFVLGLMVELADQYVLTSNRESGFGRYDVMLEPRRLEDMGGIIEFKVQEEDEKELADFAQKILAKIQSDAPTTPLFLPGNRPYRKYGGVPMKPITGKACNQCGVCARECPVGAINAENPSQTNTETCISCMRCLAVCPQNARHISKMLLTAGSLKLKSACSGYKNNELFLP